MQHVSPARELADGDWPLAERLRWLRRFRVSVASNERELCRLVNADVGKPEWEALTADIMPLLAACRWLEKRAPRLLKERKLGGAPVWQWGTHARERRVPLGTVGIIATWNYPIQLLGIQLVQALGAGNRVVVKPSEHAPQSQEALLRLAVEAGLPRGQLRWTESTREAGRRMLEAERLDHVIFTGSTRVGRQVAAWAAERLVPTTLELSGCDSAIVLADADARLAAKAIWHAAVMNGGQTCLAPRRVLVDQRIYGAFVRAIGLHAAGARPVRLISAAATLRCAELVAAAIEAGGRSISGFVEPVRGADVTPTVVVDCPRNAELVGGDHFGPVLAVVAVTGLDDALAVHGQCGQHLATSVFTRDGDRVRSACERFGVTMVSINDAVLPASHPAASVGGVGASGWGLSRGEAGLLAMTRPVYVTRTSSWWRVPLGDPGAERLEQLRRIVARLFGARRAKQPPREDSYVEPRLGAAGPARASPSTLGTMTRRMPQNGT